MGYHQTNNICNIGVLKEEERETQKAYLREIIAENVSKLGRDLDI